MSSKKIPDLLEVMEKARTRDGARMGQSFGDNLVAMKSIRWEIPDALALRLEGDILAVAGRLQSQCQQMIWCEGQDDEETDTFDDLWFQLNDLFKKISDHCDIFVPILKSFYSIAANIQKVQ